MRIDKYLKNARIIKRRTMAKKACEQGRVSVNKKIAKPGDIVKIGDVIQVDFGTGSTKIEVLKIFENVKKDDAIKMYKMME